MKEKNYSGQSRISKFFFGLNILFIIGLLLSYLSTYINPEKVTFMAFFGLMYPVFLAPVALLMVYWLFKRSKKFLWSLVAIMLGFTHFSHYFQITLFNRNEEDRKTEIKIMSYNVRDFDLYDWIHNENTKQEIFDFLKKEDPDVICFQEFYFDERPNPGFDTRDALLTILSAKNFAEGYTLRGTGHGLFGNVTFSKYPIVNQGHVKFENDKGNSFIYTDLEVGGDTIRVYNAHIGSVGFELEDYQLLGTEGNHKTWPHVPSEKKPKPYERLSIGYSKRVSQTRKLVDHTEQSPHPVVICGDFNDTPVSYNYRQLTKDYWDAFTLSGNGIQGTYTKMPFIRIDYIFHAEFFNSYNYTTYDQELSDHRAISTVIEF